MKIQAVMSNTKAELKAVVLIFGPEERYLQRQFEADIASVFGGYGLVSTEDGGWSIIIRNNPLYDLGGEVERILHRYYPHNVVRGCVVDLMESGCAETV